MFHLGLSLTLARSLEQLNGALVSRSCDPVHTQAHWATPSDSGGLKRAGRGLYRNEENRTQSWKNLIFRKRVASCLALLGRPC